MSSVVISLLFIANRWLSSKGVGSCRDFDLFFLRFFSFFLLSVVSFGHCASFQMVFLNCYNLFSKATQLKWGWMKLCIKAIVLKCACLGMSKSGSGIGCCIWPNSWNGSFRSHTCNEAWLGLQKFVLIAIKARGRHFFQKYAYLYNLYSSICSKPNFTNYMIVERVFF